MKRVLVSTSGWAMILCLLAAVSTVISPYYWSPLTGVGTYNAAGLRVSGYGGWERPVIAGLGFFFVFFTRRIRPVPWWRSLGIVVAALGVYFFVPFKAEQLYKPAPYPPPDWGADLAFLCSAGLLLVAVLETRHLVNRLRLSTFGWAVRPLASTSGWAMILCLLAAVSPLTPWGPPRGAVWYSDGSLIPAFPGGEVWASGYGGWEGPVINIVAGLGFFFVFATSAIRPVPWWRSLGISVAGVGVIVIVLLNRAWCSFPIREWGPLLAMLSSAGLVPIAALEIRHFIASRIISRSE